MSTQVAERRDEMLAGLRHEIKRCRVASVFVEPQAALLPLLDYCLTRCDSIEAAFAEVEENTHNTTPRFMAESTAGYAEKELSSLAHVFQLCGTCHKFLGTGDHGFCWKVHE